MGRHVGGSILPSNSPRILQPMDMPGGSILQVRVIPEEDTHGLFVAGRVDGDVQLLLAKHPNGYSCRQLGEHLRDNRHIAAKQQAEYIVACGGEVTEIGWRLVLA